MNQLLETFDFGLELAKLKVTNRFGASILTYLFLFQEDPFLLSLARQRMPYLQQVQRIRALGKLQAGIQFLCGCQSHGQSFRFLRPLPQHLIAADDA